MSKILLIKPRFLSLQLRVVTQPLGLMYIGAVLKKVGHETRIYDCALDSKHHKKLKRILVEWQPEYIGISIFITELVQVKQITEIVRKFLPNAPIIFGGPWPTANPEDSILKYDANFVVIGEGENVFPELINALNNKYTTYDINGVASLVNGKVRVNPGRFLTEKELNSLPFPAWDLIDHGLYARMQSIISVGCRPYMSIITSRGCPYKCAYCHQTMGKVFRKRSAEVVLAEIEKLRFKYGFKEFEIVDDCFNLDRKRMYDILTGIAENFSDIRLHFASGLRSDILETEDLKLFKKAGTVSAGFAIESSSLRIQKMINKNLDLEKATSIIKASVDSGIYSIGFFMIGFPTETYEEASATVDFAIRSPLHAAMFLLVTPFAGTDLAEMAKEVLQDRHKTTDPRYINFFNNPLNISAMSDDELQKVFRYAYRRFYFHPRRILQQIVSHPNIFSLPKSAFGALIRAFPRKQHDC